MDSCFAHFDHWVNEHLKAPSRIIKDIDTLVSVCQEGAQRDMELQAPSAVGKSWHVLRYEQDQKPSHTWTMPDAEFQIQNTYCLQLEEMLAIAAKFTGTIACSLTWMREPCSLPQ